MTRTTLIELVAIEVVYTSGPPWARRRFAAVRDVDLSIAAGETVGLVGESGSGKTTLGQVCLGILRPTTGTALLEGRPLAGRHRTVRGRLQMVAQHPEWSLNPRLRVGTSVAEPLAILDEEDRAGRRRRAERMLERVGLPAEYARRYPHQLSGGQRQRVAIARALITNPRFIVFDEVVSALDVSIQAQVLNLIRDLRAEVGFGSLFISHDLAAVRYVSDRVAVMQSGELVEVAAASTFYDRPAHPHSLELLASIAPPTTRRIQWSA